MLILANENDVHLKLHEALVAFVGPSRWHSWFKEKGSRNGISVCFQSFVEQRVPSRGVMLHEASLENRLKT